MNHVKQQGLEAVTGLRGDNVSNISKKILTLIWPKGGEKLSKDLIKI
jgi:hypothetical protein